MYGVHRSGEELARRMEERVQRAREGFPYIRTPIWSRSPSPPPPPSMKASSKASGVVNVKKEDRREIKEGNDKKKKRDISSSSSSSSDSSEDDSSSSEEQRRKRKKKSSKKGSKKDKKKRHQKKKERKEEEEEEEEGKRERIVASSSPLSSVVSQSLIKDEMAYSHNEEEYDEEDVGPQPLSSQRREEEEGEGGMKRQLGVRYGNALLPGEGAAIASFVQQNLRIPRRGEIGWSGDEISGLETQGYVMSGSRHRRMNAVRLRKENQVYSAEEKRALALITFEEKQQKDNKIIEDFRAMLQQKMEGASASTAGLAGEKK